MMFRKAGLLLILFFILISNITARLYDNTLTIHPFINSKESCNNCHNKNNLKIEIKNPARACAPLCLTCHKNMDNHHSIKLKIHDKLPENIILTGKKRITCISCHKLDSKRYDNVSWKAESMFEKVFRGKDQYKTYYLIKKNNSGQLCKTCH